MDYERNSYRNDHQYLASRFYPYKGTLVIIFYISLFVSSMKKKQQKEDTEKAIKELGDMNSNFLDRNSRSGNSNQLSLGELIEKIKACRSTYVGSDHIINSKHVFFDFNYCFPTHLKSWRGSYNELALGFGFEGYSKFSEDSKPMTVKEFLDMLEGAVGKTYSGWKGGEFVMSRETPLWVANWGNLGSTGIEDIIEDDYRITLKTAYFEH